MDNSELRQRIAELDDMGDILCENTSNYLAGKSTNLSKEDIQEQFDRYYNANMKLLDEVS